MAKGNSALEDPQGGRGRRQALHNQPLQEQLGELFHTFGGGVGAADESRLLLTSLRPADIANLLESMPPHMRQVTWELLDEESRNLVLQHLVEDVRGEFLETMNASQLAAAADNLATDDFADILHQLPAHITQEVLTKLDAADRSRVESVLSYADDCAGGLMDTDTITVRPRHALELVLRYLRLRKELPLATDSLIVVNSRDEYVGQLSLAKLLTSDPSVTVREVMDSDAPVIPVTMMDTEVAHIFSEQDLISAPVLDEDGRLLGRITIDDVVDVILEDAEEAVLGPAGLDTEDDFFAPIMKSFKRRSLWLTINLLTAFVAAAVINIFEETITKVVALAVLMPIVASMGGIAGTQTLTLVIRGMALGHVGRANLLYMVNREFMVAALNGVLLAGIVAVAAALAFQDLSLGYIIAIAMVTNIIVAAIAGALLPSLLNWMKIDPAIAGGVVLTTITDVTGFFVFLGLATLVYA